MTRDTSAPTVPLVEPMPLLREPDPDKIDLYLVDRVNALYDVDWGVRAHEGSVGRTPLNRYLCAEAAYMADIERRRSLTSPPPGVSVLGWREPRELPFADWTQRAYFGPASPLEQRLVTYRAEEETVKYVDQNLKRLRRRGRATLADLGAWPWALAPKNGRLPRRLAGAGRLPTRARGLGCRAFDAALMPCRRPLAAASRP